jgi:DGQHR domain-containing protein
MDNPVTQLLGHDSLTFSPAIIGQSLNVWTMRGYARLDELALISIADVADDLNNQSAPQRSPDKKHATEAMDYALGAMDGEDSALTRFFPEVILNVRDLDVVSFTDEKGRLLEFNSTSGPSLETNIAIIKVLASKINRESKKPQISVVDGNHRLYNALEIKKEDPEQEFPVVSYAILVGLTEMQEAILFKDLNGTHKGMDTSHLAALQAEIEGPRILLSYPAGQANWMAHQLKAKDMPFSGMVRSHTNKKAFKDAKMAVPPITLKALATGAGRSISKSSQLSGLFKGPFSSEEEQFRNAMVAKAALAKYWNAVIKNFPDAWNDRKNYILLQSVGLNAFSSLAGVIIDHCVSSGKLKDSDMDVILKHVADRVDLAKVKWEAVAGAAGAEKVYKALYDAFNEDMDKTLMLSAWGEAPQSGLI